MRFTEISESTTSGSVSTVAMPLGKTQTRTQVAGLQPVQKVMGGTSKKKGPYGNSINESAELSEADLQEDDIILVPGQGRKMKTGFVPHGQSRLDHEVEMARSDLYSAAKNAQQVYAMIKDVSEDEGLEGWVQEKIIKANDYLNTIREYLEGKQVQGMAEGKGPLGQGDLGLALKSLGGNWSGWHEEKSHDPDIEVYEYDDGEGGYYASGSIEHNLNTGEIEVHYQDDESNIDVDDTFHSIGDAMKALRGGNSYPTWGGKKPNFDRLGQRKQHGSDDLRKTDRTGRKGTLAGGPTNQLKQNIQWSKGKHGPQGVLPEGAKVDRMVKHVAQSEKKLGHSKKEAENIAWATANKRGMLDNKNKKAK